MSHLDLSRKLACVAALAGAVAAAPVPAALIEGNVADSVSHTGSTFMANLTYSAATDALATLTVSLQNTSPSSVGGTLTAFVLNNPGDKISGVSLTSPPTNWSQLGLGDVNG